MTAPKSSPVAAWIAKIPGPGTWAMWTVAVAIAAAGGAVASWIGTPLPWLLGAMVATAIAMALGVKIAGMPLSIPQPARMTFVAVIGIAIGGTATPEMFDDLPDWWMSLAAVALFVLVAQAMNYQIFRRFAGYDRPTAYYCATPGGLIESVQLGEEAGGNPALLAVQHFSRITITVITVPILYWMIRGEAVGSAAGVELEAVPTPIGVWDIGVLAACGFIGAVGGRKVGLPAAIVTGPILLSVIAHATGLTAAQPPGWMIAIAQLVVGLGLAARFQGLPRQALGRGIAMGLITVAAMLGLGAAFAEALSAMGGQPWQVLFMCFAPGGVVEMGLIALSLEVSPILVTLHHILRISFTVVAVPLASRLVLPSDP